VDVGESPAEMAFKGLAYRRRISFTGKDAERQRIVQYDRREGPFFCGESRLNDGAVLKKRGGERASQRCLSKKAEYPREPKYKAGSSRSRCKKRGFL